MELPNLPTDNLYKFKALSGVLMIIVSSVIITTSNLTILKEIDIMEAESVQSDTEIKFLEEDTKILINDISKLQVRDSTKNNINVDSDITKLFENNTNILEKDKNLREYFEFIFKYENKIFPENIKIKEINDKRNKIRDISRKISLKLALTDQKLKSEREKLHTLIFIDIIFTILIIIGSFMAKLGFEEWYNLVQKPMDEKLKLELEELRKKKD